LGLSWGERSLVIEATPEECFAAITDYETFPRWKQAVIATEVLDRGQDGLASRVRTTSDAKFRTVTYTLDYHHYDRPGESGGTR
jgi:uncharacterized protein YndB with AHSA1/START domain